MKNFKIDLHDGRGVKGIFWIDLAQDGGRWLYLVNEVMNWVP